MRVSRHNDKRTVAAGRTLLLLCCIRSRHPATLPRHAWSLPHGPSMPGAARTAASTGRRGVQQTFSQWRHIRARTGPRGPRLPDTRLAPMKPARCMACMRGQHAQLHAAADLRQRRQLVAECLAHESRRKHAHAHPPPPHPHHHTRTHTLTPPIHARTSGIVTTSAHTFFV